MKWNDNLVQISKDGTVGDCPYCKSSNTDYVFWENKNGRGSLNIWCNSCGERIHVDCSSVPENRKRISLEMALELKRERGA